FVAEDSPRLGRGEAPKDLSSCTVGTRGPRTRPIAQGVETLDSIAPMTFARPQTGLDFRGVQPAPVLRGVVRRESRPEGGATRRAKHADHRRRAMQVQVVHDEMDRLGAWIPTGHALERADKPRRLAITGRVGQVPAGVRLDDAVDVGGAPSHVLVILSRDRAL